MNELNKRLAEWAGLHWTGHYWEETGTEGIDYINDISACFKWLVPKAISYLMGQKTFDRRSAVKHLFEKWFEEYAQCFDFALALCLAIEKLIEGEINE